MNLRKSGGKRTTSRLHLNGATAAAASGCKVHFHGLIFELLIHHPVDCIDIQSPPLYQGDDGGGERILLIFLIIW